MQNMKYAIIVDGEVQMIRDDLNKLYYEMHFFMSLGIDAHVLAAPNGKKLTSLDKEEYVLFDKTDTRIINTKSFSTIVSVISALLNKPQSQYTSILDFYMITRKLPGEAEEATA